MLDLRFSTQAGRVEVSCSAEMVAELQSLRSRFASSSSAGTAVFDVDIDDFLVNVEELAAWPVSDEEVTWQPELLSLVEDNAADADTLDQRLASGDGAAPASAEKLGGGWDASLTDFQARDLGKLLGLEHGADFSVPGAGKTRVALAAFQAQRDMRAIDRMLVVCPKAAFESWKIEAAICFPDDPLRVRVVEGDHPPDCDLLLVNYERLPGAEPELIRWLKARPAVLTLDEAHRMKPGPPERGDPPVSHSVRMRRGASS